MNIRNLLFKLFRFANNYCDYTDTENLFVRFTDKCPNKCDFCFDKNCPHDTKNISGKDLATKVNAFGRKHLMISGGEPCINLNRLEEFIDNLDNDIEIESLMTSLPKTTWKNKEKFFKIVERCKLVDISSHGTTNEDDEAVYKTKLGYDKQDFIRELAQKYPEKIFVSCVMLKSKIPCFDSLYDRIFSYYNNGVLNFYLNELGNSCQFKSDKDYISINDLLQSGGFKKLPSTFAYGCKVDLSKLFRRLFDDNDMTVKCRRRCFRCGGGDVLSWMDVFKVWINSKWLHKDATPVLNETGEITDWYMYEFD